MFDLQLLHQCGRCPSSSVPQRGFVFALFSKKIECVVNGEGKGGRRGAEQ